MVYEQQQTKTNKDDNKKQQTEQLSSRASNRASIFYKKNRANKFLHKSINKEYRQLLFKGTFLQIRKQ